MHGDYRKTLLISYRLQKTRFLLWRNHARLARTLLIVFGYLAVLIGAIVLLLL